VLCHFATCTSVNCLTCVLGMTLNYIHPIGIIKSNRIWEVKRLDTKLLLLCNWCVLLWIVLHCYCVTWGNVHCVSLAILSRLSQFPCHAVGTNWPLCSGAGTGGHVPTPLSEVDGHGGHNLNEGNHGCNSGRPLSRGLKSIIDKTPIY